MILHCYCCGQPLGRNIALVSMSSPSDSVFVMLPEHAKRADDADYVIVTVAP